MRPLSWAGLWLAVTIRPASAPSARTAYASRGVGRARGSTRALTPAPSRISAQSRANRAELCRASKPITAVGCSCRARRYAAMPAAARETVTRFIRCGPGPMRPRSPAVPNSRGPRKASAISACAVASPAAAASSSRCNSARVAGSGSSASHSAWPGGSVQPPLSVRTTAAGSPGRGANPSARLMPCPRRAPPRGSAVRRSCRRRGW